LHKSSAEKFVENQKFAEAQLQQYLSSEDLDALIFKQSAQMRLSNREPIKHLLIGSPKAVTSTIVNARIKISGVQWNVKSINQILFICCCQNRMLPTHTPYFS
jgi:hypothetical protein